MNELTPEQLAEKIKKVQQDVKELQSQAVAGRKLEVLSEYQQYLEDELRILSNQQNDLGKNKKT